MNWKDLAGPIGKMAPVVGGLLMGPAGSAVGTLVAAALGTPAEPDAVQAAVSRDPQAAEKIIAMQNEHQKTIAALIANLATTQITEGAQTVRTEVTSDSWITKNWRPLLMLLFGAIIANNYIISPYVQAMFGAGVSLPIPPDMWQLLKLGIGGYVIGRSSEKMLSAYLGAR